MTLIGYKAALSGRMWYGKVLYFSQLSGKNITHPFRYIALRGVQLIDNPFSIDILLRWSKGAAILFLKGQKLYIPLIGYKEAQSNRMGYKEAQSRMNVLQRGTI